MKLLSKLPRIPVPAAFRPAHPTLAAEIGEGVISFVRLARAGGRATVAGFHVGELTPGALRLSAVQPNVIDADELRRHVRAAKARLAPSGGPIALCVPDPLARIALLQLEALPARDAEVQELVAWRLKRQLPYRLDEARVGWKAIGSRNATTTVLAAAMRQRVLSELEGLLAAEGFEVGVVTASTLALAEAAPRSEQDTLLVHASDGWFTLLWLDPSQPLLIRTKQLPASDSEGAARDAAIAAELPPTIEYATQRLERSGGLRILVHDALGRGAELAARIEVACSVPAVVLRATPASPLPPGIAERLGPACGLAVRGLVPETSLAMEPSP